MNVCRYFRHVIQQRKKKPFTFILSKVPLSLLFPFIYPREEDAFCARGFVKHDGVYEPCQRLQPLCSQVSRPLTSGRGAAIVLERTSSGYPALTQKAGKAGLRYQSLGDGARWHKSGVFERRFQNGRCTSYYATLNLTDCFLPLPINLLHSGFKTLLFLTGQRRL